jgi:hypothetical protein
LTQGLADLVPLFVTTVTFTVSVALLTVLSAIGVTWSGACDGPRRETMSLPPLVSSSFTVLH